MEVYYVRPLFSAAHGYQPSQAPPGLWIPSIPASSSNAATTMLYSQNVEAGGPGHSLTGGGLIRHGSTVYMLTAPDMTMAGWRACVARSGRSGHHRHGSSHTKHSSSSASGSSPSTAGVSPSSQSSSRSGGKRRTSETKTGSSSSSSSSSDHSACQRLYESHCITKSHRQQYSAQSQTPQPEISGCLGHLVHFSARYGFGLVQIDPAAMYLLEDHNMGGSGGAEMADPEVAMASCYARAVPLEDFKRCMDKPQVTDFVEFGTSDGEAVTGLVGSMVDYCCNTRSSSSSSRRSGGSSSSSSDTMTTKILVVQTSSYAVAPTDCGIWVRRSIASDNPLLLGHVVGSVDGDSAGSSVFGGELVESGTDYYGQYAYDTTGHGSAGGVDGGASSEMLVLPFVGFADELHRVVSSGRFNLL
ncbi:hypothetical protein MN608_00709 [Microdochium nivale]|nr:hypothetical protein MN608_00709 [Microdochium nivale]